LVASDHFAAYQDIRPPAATGARASTTLADARPHWIKQGLSETAVVVIGT
jgi:hypothetical protein